MGKKVGKLIKAARTDADMTQEQLARRISGLSANDISLAERGEKDLTQAQLKKIATVTGVTQASLINAAKEENKSSAIILLAVRMVGFALVVLFFFDLLPIHRLVGNKYMVSGIMGAMFLIFIVMGIVSMKNFRGTVNIASTSSGLGFAC